MYIATVGPGQSSISQPFSDSIEAPSIGKQAIYLILLKFAAVIIIASVGLKLSTSSTPISASSVTGEATKCFLLYY